MQKPGWQTTEFWITLVAQFLPLLIVLGVVKSGDAPTIESALKDGIMAVGAFAASGATMWKYIQSRIEVKTAAIEAEAKPEG